MVTKSTPAFKYLLLNVIGGCWRQDGRLDGHNGPNLIKSVRCLVLCEPRFFEPSGELVESIALGKWMKAIHERMQIPDLDE